MHIDNHIDMVKIGPKEAQRIALRKQALQPAKEVVPHQHPRTREVRPEAGDKTPPPPTGRKAGAGLAATADPGEIERALRFYRAHRERQRLARARRKAAKAKANAPPSD